MKIAYIYDAVYPWIKGGGEKRIYEIGKRLADKGHEVHWYEIGCGKMRRIMRTLTKLKGDFDA